MLKNLFVLRINNYRPLLCQYTIPTIKAWAHKNNYIYNEIVERKFPDMPITMEKLQVYDLGKDSDINLLCDADLMLRPDFIDPLTFTNPNTVVTSYHFNASEKFNNNLYFHRDGRNLGLSGGFILTSQLTHDLWKYDLNEFQWYLDSTHKNPHLVDEFVISTNLAKYGLKYDGASNDPDTYIVHFGDADLTAVEKAQSEVNAQELWNNWVCIWPELERFK